LQKWQYQEVKRIKSPGSPVEAVIVTGDAGATTATTSLVYLVKADDAVRFDEQGDIIFRADHVKNLDVRWKTPTVIEIAYDEARISEFQNCWQNAELRQVIEARLAPTRSDSSLSPADQIWN
jgi:hypothetical protein